MSGFKGLKFRAPGLNCRVEAEPPVQFFLGGGVRGGG